MSMFADDYAMIHRHPVGAGLVRHRLEVGGRRDETRCGLMELGRTRYFAIRSRRSQRRVVRCPDTGAKAAPRNSRRMPSMILRDSSSVCGMRHRRILGHYPPPQNARPWSFRAYA